MERKTMIKVTVIMCIAAILLFVHFVPQKPFADEGELEIFTVERLSETSDAAEEISVPGIETILQEMTCSRLNKYIFGRVPGVFYAADMVPLEEVVYELRGSYKGEDIGIFLGSPKYSYVYWIDGSRRYKIRNSEELMERFQHSRQKKAE